MSQESRDTFDPALLRPSLQGDRPAQPIFSSRAGFWVAFLGGVYGSAIFGAFNLARMRTLRRDGWICLAGALLWTGLVLWYGAAMADPAQAPAWLRELGTGARPIRLASRGLGLVLFGVLYLRQRSLYAAQRLTSDDSANPWPIGVASVLAAGVLELAVRFAGGLS
jgi:hypothetical protein